MSQSRQHQFWFEWYNLIANAKSRNWYYQRAIPKCEQLYQPIAFYKCHVFWDPDPLLFWMLLICLLTSEMMSTFINFQFYINLTESKTKKKSYLHHRFIAGIVAHVKHTIFLIPIFAKEFVQNQKRSMTFRPINRRFNFDSFFSWHWVKSIFSNDIRNFDGHPILHILRNIMIMIHQWNMFVLNPSTKYVDKLKYFNLKNNLLRKKVGNLLYFNNLAVDVPLLQWWSSISYSSSTFPK